MEGASSVSFDCNAAVSKDNDDAADDVDDSALLAAAIMRKEGMRPRHRAIAIAILVLSPSSFVLLLFMPFSKGSCMLSCRCRWCRTGNPFLERLWNIMSHIIFARYRIFINNMRHPYSDMRQ
jgi:hypothetical protein